MDELRHWIHAAEAARVTCLNTPEFDVLIRHQKRRLEALEGASVESDQLKPTEWLATYRKQYPAKPMRRAPNNDDELIRMPQDQGVYELPHRPATQSQFPRASSPPRTKETAREARHLWVIRSGDVPVALEACAWGTTLQSMCIKHSNLTGGDDAHSGGEIWFINDDRIAVNAQSGRYGAESDREFKMIVDALRHLRIFGWEKLKDLADRTATPIVADADEPYRSIDQQLRSMGVNFSDAARKYHWSQDSVRRFEQRRQVPFRDFERMAQGIDLDENQLGTTSGAGADRQLGVRLRTFKSSDPKRFTVNTVLGLAEAAWTIRKQFDLASLVKEHDQSAIRELGFSPSNDYGTKLAPAYTAGYRLASKTRELLGISSKAPIESLKDLIEVRLRIPVIQLELHSDFAGATIASGSHRGIVVNLAGDNSNPLVRRMTMAHELGHLLWDPDQSLDKLRVDRYDQIGFDAAAENYPLDHVERRANAFAIEFLAPGNAVMTEFKKAGGGAAGLEEVITAFGVSKTAIARHLSNASHNVIDVLEERVPRISFEGWDARESLAVPVFDPQDVPVSRRGRFAYYVYKAFEEHLISNDTAASLYRCKLSELSTALTSTKNYIASE